MDFKWWIYLQWHQIYCATQTSGSTWGPPGDRGERWVPTSCYILEWA